MGRPARIVPEDEFRKIIEETVPFSKHTYDLCQRIVKTDWAKKRVSTSGALCPMDTQSVYINLKKYGIKPEFTAKKNCIQVFESAINEEVPNEVIPPVQPDDIFPAVQISGFALKPHPRANGRLLKTYIPSGYCPAEPKGWKRGEVTEEDIRTWAREVYMYDRSGMEYFTKEAVLYWLRDFFNIHSEEYKKWADVVESELGEVE